MVRYGVRPTAQEAWRGGGTQYCVVKRGAWSMDKVQQLRRAHPGGPRGSCLGSSV